MSPTDISVAVAIPTQNAIDVLTTAAEGGSNYWLTDEQDFLEVSVQRNDQNEVVLIAFNGKDGKRFSVSPAEVAVAWTRIMRCEVQLRDDLRRMISGLPCADCDIDAEGADALVQIAAFGEVVYG